MRPLLINFLHTLLPCWLTVSCGVCGRLCGTKGLSRIGGTSSCPAKGKTQLMMKFTWWNKPARTHSAIRYTISSQPLSLARSEGSKPCSLGVPRAWRTPGNVSKCENSWVNLYLAEKWRGVSRAGCCGLANVSGNITNIFDQLMTRNNAKGSTSSHASRCIYHNNTCTQAVCIGRKRGIGQPY